MVHSMAGGTLGKEVFCDFAKVRLLEGDHIGEIYWFIALKDVGVGNKVIVPFGLRNELLMGEVLRVDKNVSSYSSPIPVKMAKKIVKVL